MTRFRLGKSKRLAAFLCALLLTLETVAFPVTQAKAAATAALATVGFGVTTAAFLAACGIYPYWADDSSAVNFDWEDWVDDDLTAVVNEYNAANSTTPINPNQISAFLSGATLLVGNYAWEKLCDFAEWIKMKYAVTDNQTGVELGSVSAPGLVPSFDSAPSAQTLGAQGLALSGLSAPTNGVGYVGVVASAPVFACYAGFFSSPDGFLTYVSKQNFTVYTVKADSDGIVDRTYTSLSAGRVSSSSGVSGFAITESGGYNLGFPLSTISTIPVGILRFQSLQQAYNYYLSGDGANLSLNGITADTTTVSVPDALPQGTEYGGLRVSGLPAATTAESVTDAVQDSVGERLKTPVDVVEVELAPGTEVDSETGAITQNPVVIEAPVAETIPALSALVPAQEFIAAMTEALQTKFPFCLPFDFMRVLQAFVKPPDAPVITMTFFDRIGGGNYTVTVDLSPWDDVAAVVRRLESMILFLGFWLNFDKFNVLNIILGQIG